MMKIEYDEKNIILPDLRLINVFQNNVNYKLTKEFLEYFFGKKKKAKCTVRNIENLPVSCNEMNYIYIENDSSIIAENMEFKSKSFLNKSFEDLIKSNQTDFYGLESVRESIRNLKSDKGFYKIQKIMERGVAGHCSLEFTDFPCSSILSMLSLKCNTLSKEQQLMMLYNLSIYLNRDKPVIVNLSFGLDQKVLEWIYTYDNSNVYFIITADQIECSILPKENKLQYIVLNDSEFTKTENYMPEEFDLLCYSQNSFIQKYLCLQSITIQRIADEFRKNDKNYICLF